MPTMPHKPPRRAGEQFWAWLLPLMGMLFGAASANAGAAPFLLVIYCSGGWDASMVFDPKLDSTLVAAESGAQSVQVGNLTYTDHANRPSVKQFFTANGAQSVIIRGIKTSSLDHRNAYLTAFAALPPGKDRPIDLATFYAISVNPVAPLPHVVIDAPIIPGDQSPSVARLTSARIDEYLAAAPGDTLGTQGEAALLTMRKSAFARRLDKINQTSLDFEKLSALNASFAREAKLTDALTKASGTLPKDTVSTLVKHGRIAIELFAQGSSQAVTIQAGAAGAWNSTEDNFASQTTNYEALFSGLNSIISYAASRKVDTNLLILVASDMGRTPKLNARGGKGPWPYTSALLWGSGLNGASTIGLTDSALRATPFDPVFGTPGGPTAIVPGMLNIYASLYLATGVPSKLIMADSVKPLSKLMKVSP